MRTLLRRLFVLSAGAAAWFGSTSAVAADFTLSLIAPRNHSVMREAEATIVVRVSNAGAAPSAIPGVNFKFNGDCIGANTNDFSESMTAPSGWSVGSPIGGDLVRFVASAGSEIQPGQVLDFQIRLKGNARAAIQADTSDRQDTFGLVEAEYPTGKQTLSCASAGAVPRWTRHALALVAVVDPLSAASGGSVSLDLQLENRSTSVKSSLNMMSGFPGSNPAGATFSAPSPALPIGSLAVGNAVTIQRTVSTLPEPSFVIEARMRDGSGTSTTPLVVTETVYVGPLTASLSVSPSAAASGATVDVEMVVTNHTAYSLGNVRPDGNPVQVGTASAALVSGPTPASVSSLAPNSSATFRWTYTVTGAALETYVFEGRALSNGYTSPFAQSNVGEIAAFTAVANPGSIASGDAGPIDFLVDNGSSVTIEKTITFFYPAGWVVNSAPAPTGWTSLIMDAGRTVEYTANGDTLAPGDRIAFPHGYATVPAPTGTADVEHSINVEFKPNNGAPYFAVATLISTATRLSLATSPSPAVTPADGKSLVTLTATLTRVSNGAAIAGEKVSFATTTGELSASSAITDATGKASVTVKAPASSVDVSGTATASRFDTEDAADLLFTAFAGANLLYVGGSVYPREVAPGTTVAFSLDVTNVGTLPITLPLVSGDTGFSFTDGTTSYSSILTGSVTVAAGETTRIEFDAATVSPAMAFGSFYPTFFYNPAEILEDPVTITSSPTWASVVGLSAEAYGDGARISWSTDLEFLNEGFRVLRAVDGGEPEYLDAWVPASGEWFADYEWIDVALGPGLYEYWIEDVATDGTATRHGPAILALGVPGVPDAPTGSVLSSDASDVDPSIWLDPDDFGDVRVLEWDASGITWEITPPPHEIVTVEVPIGVRHRVTIAGWDVTDELGRPVLPLRSLLVPVPPGATGKLTLRAAQDVTIEAVDPTFAGGVASNDPIAGGAIRTTPPASASIDGESWPPSPVALVDRGRMGTTRVVSLVVTPMRWNPRTRDLRRANRLVARVDFVAAPAERPAARTVEEETQQDIVRGPSLEVSVAREGLVRVPLAEIAAAGVDPANAAVYRRGVAVPARIEGDALLFVAPPFDAQWGRGQTFWIAPGASLAMPAESGAPAVGAAASDGRHLLAFEQDSFFAPLTAQGIGPDRWYWTQVMSGGPATASVSLDARAGTEATLAITLQGLFDDELARDEHVIRVLLGGADLGTVVFSDFERVTAHLSIPDGTLVAGANALSIENVSARATRVALDRAELALTAPAEASVATELAVTALADGVLTASGITPSWAVDETNLRLLALSTEADRAAVSVAAGTRVRFVATPAPATWTARAPGSALDAVGADFVVVAGAGLLDAARDWAAWRASQGLRAVAIDSAAIEDELGFGDPGPAALRRFLELATAKWAQPAPRYLLLLGDSTFDPRDNLALGPAPGLLLSDRVGTHLLDAPSDSLTAALGSLDRLPDLAIGRIPARTHAEALAALAKVVAYENAPRDGWHAREVLFADDDLPQFAASAADAARYLPLGATASSIDAAQEGDAGARTRLLESLDTALVTYFGHGAVQSWGGELYLDDGDAASLANARLPVVAAVDCLNAYFDHPAAESLGEALVRAPSGAVAVWTSSAITRDGGHRELSRAFHRAFWREPLTRLGDVANRAYAHVAGRADADELIGSFLLLGDPALRLNVNRPPVAVARLLDVDGLTAQASASASYDVDGDSLAFRWELISSPAGATGTLTQSDADVTLTGTAPGLYRLRVRAADASVAGPGDDLLIELQSSAAAGEHGCSVAIDRDESAAWLALLGAAFLLRRRRR